MLKLLADLGSCFDTASVVEIELALAAGATPDRISFGNTIKKERDIARASRSACASSRSIAKPRSRRSRALPSRPASPASDVKVFCRILCDGAGAEWPLSRKFGCVPEMAVDVLEHALRQGLEAYGVSFHVGSQQRNTEAWDQALASASAIFRECAKRGIHLSMVNLGGGFPTKYLKSVPAVKIYGESIFRALSKHFGNRLPETIIEPGRGMVGNAGIIEAEVVLVSKKSRTRTRCAGSISTSASSAVSPRRWTSRSATRSAPSTTTTARCRACSPARPAIRPTFSTRRSLIRSRSRWRSATRC